ncbi:MAG: hypothetical protein Q7K45_07175 [Nanoarchaeota archaeon]|nr:hypothetical protein [Nanoarchaeota archaeon]
MKEYDLKQLLDNKLFLNQKIDDFIAKKILIHQNVDWTEIKGHLLKSEHNLRFVQENIKLGFLDWSILKALNIRTIIRAFVYTNAI